LFWAQGARGEWLQRLLIRFEVWARCASVDRLQRLLRRFVVNGARYRV